MTINKRKISPRTNIVPIREIRFGNLIKQRRIEAKITQSEFADRMNVTRNTVINWESDKSKPDYRYIPAICSILRIHLHELFGMETEAGLSDLEYRVIHNVRLLAPASRSAVDKMIGVMADEECVIKDREMKEAYSLFLVRPGMVAAGPGDYVPSEPPICTFLRKNTINAQADGIVLVDGESMEPVYHSGDYVYYENASSASPGEDVIVDTDDGAVIKRIGSDHTLYSVNQDPALTYPAKGEHNTLVIRGRVLGTVHSSEWPDEEDVRILEELFAEEIRRFNREHNISD